MRVSSLSDDRVIELLNRYYLPTWVSRDRYQLSGPDKAEQAELQRIDRQRHDRGLEGGTVTVHILSSDGSVVAALPVQKASKPAELVAFLKEYAEREKVKQRRLIPSKKPLIAWKDQQKPKTDGGVLVDVWTRFDDGSTNRGLSADTVELTAKEWSQFLPAKPAEVGQSWKVADAVADKLFAFCYPPLPNWDSRQAKVIESTLTVSVDSLKGAEAHLKLAGRFVLSYPATGKPTDGKVTAQVIGLATIDISKGVIKDLKSIATEASYVWFWENKPQPRKMSLAVELRQ